MTFVASNMIKRIETDLFLPIKTYLEGQGYSVHSEVKGADLLAQKDNQWIAVEMKTRMSLKLLTQGVRIQESFDTVYLALPLEGSKGIMSNYRDLRRTLLRLGLGLMIVRFLKTKTRVEIFLHPGEGKKRNRQAKKRGMIREIAGRYAELNIAGEVSTQEKFTAYKQQCLLVAWALNKGNPEGMSPKELRQKGFPERCGHLLGQNIYGWYERIRRGRYGLSATGHQALMRYQEELEPILKSFRNSKK